MNLNIQDIQLPSGSLKTGNRFLAKLGILILLPICLYFASDLFWKVYQAEYFAPNLKYASLAERTGQAQEARRYAWGWFDIETVRKAKPVEVSKLDAKLVGILGIGDSGFAMIAVKGKAAASFKVGDVVVEGVSLKTLGLNHVVLLSGEKEERLEMKKVNLFATDDEEDVVVARPNTIDDSEAEIDITRARWFARSIKDDPAYLLKVLKFHPVKIPEHGIGYKIRATNTPEAVQTLHSTGLKSDDVLFVANGKPIIQLAGNPASLEALLDGDKLVIRLLRNGAIKDVTISLKEE